MKKPIYLIAAVSCLIGISCEEDFSPKAPYREEYFIYSVISATNYPMDRTTSVDVVIAKSYDVDGYNPEVNTTNSAVYGAQVTLSYLNKVDTLKEYDRGAPQGKYSPTQHYYRFDDLPAFFYDSIYITAKMPNGRILKSSTTLLPEIYPSFYPELNGTINPHTSTFKWGDKFIVSWDISSSGYYRSIFFPKVCIDYLVTSGEEKKSYLMEVPLKFIKKDGKEVPLFSSVTEGSSAEFEFRAFDSAMVWIGNKVGDKSSTLIRGVNIYITNFNRHLATYYSSVNGILDQYTIRLDEQVYTNVTGGGGIFGSKRINMFYQRLNLNYIKSFGFKAQ